MTTNLSPGIPWFKKYIETTKDVHRVSITASWHREGWHKTNAPSKEELHDHMVKFADKIEFLQKNDIQVTINMVMVPEWWDTLYTEATYFNDRKINVTLKPQSDKTASFVVDGYTPEMLDILHNGMPQMNYTSEKREWKRNQSVYQNPDKMQTMQIELKDSKGNVYYLDQAERFNAFGFNKFKGWICESGYRSVIIREPDGSVKRSYSCHDQPLGNIETGFKLFDKPMPCITPSCVSSADSKIPKKKYDSKSI